MKVLLYTNIATPYRKYLYDLLYKEFKEDGDEFKVFIMAPTEKNRSWLFNDYKSEYMKLLEGTTYTIGGTYIHYNYNLKKELLSYSPDIVIGSGSYLYPGIWLLTSLKNRCGYKLYFWNESHLSEKRNYGRLKLKIRELIRNIFFQKIDAFIYAGENAKKFILNYYKGRFEGILMPNIVDPRIYLRKQIGYKKEEYLHNKTVFFCPARLSPVKGLSEFMDLLALTKNKDSALVLVAGEGELLSVLQEKAKNLNLNFVFLGYKNINEVAELYHKSDIFLLPSLSDPNPLSCIEALWAGLPLLVSNYVGNYPEVVKQGCNGYMFNYNNKAEAVKLIDEIISSDEKWRNEASKVSLSIAYEHFNPQKVAQYVRDEIKKNM